MSISSNTLFTFFFMTFSLTYSFDVLYCRRYISLPFAESSIFCSGYNTPLSSQLLFTAVVESSNSDPPYYFNSLVTNSGVGLAELC
ncbi:hypothetical protein B296_00055100 [Ensete ventricosum]|uniref:Uncharacterized protein n=1 Tax=Ensete ventricosum TaxID=4639 RepID=A0A426XFT2_ENSVE|nr:hypothetical protein B296_00055100 [Ensete ventricosum]